ncbi:hypothetical protein J6590_009025 [Homalodisca vitripennis]|nr:hypothetical protein J6590_009025 [Homalodisca vitripennis]
MEAKSQEGIKDRTGEMKAVKNENVNGSAGRTRHSRTGHTGYIYSGSAGRDRHFTTALVTPVLRKGWKT